MVKINVNGVDHSFDGDPSMPLLWYLRDVLGLTGTKFGASGLHPVQKAWIEVNAPQCGYCQSGQIMQAIALLKSKPHPTDQDIEDGMAGNICRCGTYQRIRAAIKLAAEKSA